MRKRAKLFVSACFYYSGLANLVRWWTLRLGQRLVILNYHRADGGNLRSHLLYLHRHFRILHLENALEELYAPHRDRMCLLDRRSPLVLTFDDGYDDNYTRAFALVNELQVPITIFLIPGYMESGSAFWWLDRFIRHAQVNQAVFEDVTYRLDRQEERKTLAQAIDARFSQASSADEREEFIGSLRDLLAIPSTTVSKEEPILLLEWAQVREMEGSSWVSFGAHTMHHPCLGELAGADEVQYEVGACRTLLEQHLGHSVRSFAYPYGKRLHIGKHGCCAVQKAGYNWALTTIPGFNTLRSDPYLLRRVVADVGEHWLVIAAKTSGSGIWDVYFRLYTRLRKVFRFFFPKT